MPDHNAPGARASKRPAVFLPLLLILGAVVAVLVTSLVGVAAPMGPGEGGGRLADYASVGRDLARDGATMGTRIGRPTPMAALAWIACRHLGDHAYSTRIPAIALSLWAVCALALVVWRGWGSWCAVGAVLILQVLPRMQAFSAVPDQEMPAVAAMLMAGAAYLRCRDGLRLGAAIATGFWLLVAGAFGWGVYGFGLALAIGLARAGLGNPTVTDGGASRPVESPLLFVMMARKSRGLFTAGKVLVALLVIEVIGLFWLRSVVGPQGAAWPRTFARQVSPAFELLLPPAWIALGVWLASLPARILFRRIAFRDFVPMGLAAAGAILTVTSPAGIHRSWLTPLAALVAIAVVDLAVQSAAISRRWVPDRRWLGLVGSTALVAGWLVVSAPAGLRALLASRGTAGAAPTVEDELRMVARLVNEKTTPRDLILIHQNFSTSGPFHHDLDRKVESLAELKGLAERRDQQGNLLVLLRDPLPPADAALLGPLLRAHPAARLGTAWMVDLRRHDAGVRDYVYEARLRPVGSPLLAWQRLSLYPSDRILAIRRQPWQELELDLAFGVAPVSEHRPDVELPADSDRSRLLTYHAFQNLVGDAARKARARKQLLRDFEIPATWMDPAPFGFVAGASWSPREHALVIVWECPRRPPAADDFALRLALKPLTRNWKSETRDYPPSGACLGARAEDLRQENLAVKLPYFGRWRASLEITRPRPRGGRQTTGHTVDLLVIEHTRR